VVQTAGSPIKKIKYSCLKKIVNQSFKKSCQQNIIDNKNHPIVFLQSKNYPPIALYYPISCANMILGISLFILNLADDEIPSVASKLRSQ
jgi:hypothetical protein